LYAAKESIVTGSRLPFPEAVATERRLFTGLTSGLAVTERSSGPADA
jgi:hypothetical protein